MRATLDIPWNEQFAYVDLIGMMKDTVKLNHFPWQSYDFDFMGLNHLIPFLKYPDQSFDLMITDIDVRLSPPSFKELDWITFSPMGKVIKNNQELHQYKVDGPGLDHQGGLIWFDLKGHLVGFEIQKPDEPGYTSGKLQLIEKKAFSVDQWESFIKEKARTKE